MAGPDISTNLATGDGFGVFRQEKATIRYHPNSPIAGTACIAKAGKGNIGINIYIQVGDMKYILYITQ